MFNNGIMNKQRDIDDGGGSIPTISDEFFSRLEKTGTQVLQGIYRFEGGNNFQVRPCLLDTTDGKPLGKAHIVFAGTKESFIPSKDLSIKEVTPDGRKISIKLFPLAYDDRIGDFIAWIM